MQDSNIHSIINQLTKPHLLPISQCMPLSVQAKNESSSHALTNCILYYSACTLLIYHWATLGCWWQYQAFDSLFLSIIYHDTQFLFQNFCSINDYKYIPFFTKVKPTYWNKNGVPVIEKTGLFSSKKIIFKRDKTYQGEQEPKHFKK